MPRDKSVSHEKIIRAAMDEFAEYGYDKASMRRIGKRCDLTAAALYRHFDCKEAMFDALVEPAVKDVRLWLGNQMALFDKAASSESHISYEDGADYCSMLMTGMMRELIYPRMDEFSMIISKARGSIYEDFLNDLVAEFQEIIERYFELNGEKGIGVSSEELHMLITACCTALLEPVAHGYSEKNALKYLDTIEDFFRQGWRHISGNQTVKPHS